MSDNLPELPPADFAAWAEGDNGIPKITTGYSSEATLAYGQQCWNHALEEAALASRYLPGFTYEQCSLFENAVLALRGET